MPYKDPSSQTERNKLNRAKQDKAAQEAGWKDFAEFARFVRERLVEVPEKPILTNS